MSRIGAQQGDLFGKKTQFFECQTQGMFIDMPLYISIEAGNMKAFAHVAFQLYHLHTIGGKSSQRLVEGSRDISNFKDKAGDIVFLI